LTHIHEVTDAAADGEQYEHDGNDDASAAAAVVVAAWEPPNNSVSDWNTGIDRR
jgi:hypothetical protein